MPSFGPWVHCSLEPDLIMGDRAWCPLSSPPSECCPYINLSIVKDDNDEPEEAKEHPLFLTNPILYDEEDPSSNPLNFPPSYACPHYPLWKPKSLKSIGSLMSIFCEEASYNHECVICLQRVIREGVRYNVCVCLCFSFHSCFRQHLRGLQ